jgi:hypothetical protein
MMIQKNVEESDRGVLFVMDRWLVRCCINCNDYKRKGDIDK